jgi:hypothetical protein
LLTILSSQVALPTLAQGAVPDQDALLPPEVVPMDSAGANNFAASAPAQATNYASSGNYAPYNNNGSNGMGSPNGMSPAQNSAAFNPTEMQSAQQWRKAAYDSMMNNPNAQPAYTPHKQKGNHMANNQMGQPSQMGQSGWMGGGSQQVSPPPQTQTLSGAVQQPQTQPYNNGKKSVLTGLSHAVSMGTLFGGGMLLGSAMSGRWGMNPYSAMMVGVPLTNYALRGGFSH